MVNERNQASRLILKPSKAVIENPNAYSGFKLKELSFNRHLESICLLSSG